MTFLIDVLFAALVVVNLCLAGVGRLWGAVRLVAFQGVVIGLLPFVLTGEHALIAVVNVLVKGVLLPVMLNYAIRKARTVRELEPLVGFGKSVAIVFAVTLLSFRFAPETLAVAVSFATIATGLFLIIARSSAKASPEFSLNLRSKSSTVRFFFSSPETSKIILPSFIIIRRLPCFMASFIL